MSIPVYVFPQRIPMISTDFRGADFWERYHAAEDYRRNCLDAPDCIPSGCCKKAKSGEYAVSDWNFR